MSFYTKPSMNKINCPMYRDNLSTKLANGSKAYVYVATDLNNPDLSIWFQTISRKKPEQIQTESNQIARSLFYDKYRYGTDNLLIVSEQITNVDELNTANLYEVI